MPRTDDPVLLTTDEAAALIGRTSSTIRMLVSSGKLSYVGLNDRRRPLLDRNEVLAFAEAHPAKPSKPNDEPYLVTLGALAFLEPATLSELTAYRGLHRGNVLKHLRILEATGRAVQLGRDHWATQAGLSAGRVRQDDAGVWYPDIDDDPDAPATPAASQGAA